VRKILFLQKSDFTFIITEEFLKVRSNIENTPTLLYNVAMKYYTPLKVRTYECDSYGHVNNAVYLNYLEYGRMDYLQQIGFDYNGILEAGFYLYVTHVDIHYKFSAFFNDELTIETSPIKLGAVTGTIHQRIVKKDGTLCAEADVTWASVSKDGRPSKIPENFLVEGLRPDSSDIKS